MCAAAAAVVLSGDTHGHGQVSVTGRSGAIACLGTFLNRVPLAALQEACFGLHSRGWPGPQEPLRDPARNAAHWFCEVHQGLWGVRPVSLRP